MLLAFPADGLLLFPTLESKDDSRMGHLTQSVGEALPLGCQNLRGRS
jgi:hypothetical protein